MTISAPTRPKTARYIRKMIGQLDLDEVTRNFDQSDSDIEPYTVCDGVSVDAFNDYIGDGEGLRIGLRFLSLTSDGRVLVIDQPTTVHESTTGTFSSEFLFATGNPRTIAKRGSMTATRDSLPNKEADATFGPMRGTAHRLPPPPGRDVSDWLTLVVEVGRFQPWTSLVEAAQWWCGYAGVAYILLLKVSADGATMRYCLFDIAVAGVLPEPAAQGTFQARSAPSTPVNVTFDMRRVLAIAPHQPLPLGVNDEAVVDLRELMNQVIQSI